MYIPDGYHDIPAGKLADRLGHRRAFLVGSAVFTVASMACGLAPTAELLIAFRVLQAVGAAIEIEIWALSADAFGRFVANIPPPLGIGTLTLPDGRGVKGFLVEAEAVKGGHDISDFGGWRAYMAEQRAPA